MYTYVSETQNQIVNTPPTPPRLLQNLHFPHKTFACSSQLGPPLNTVVPANIYGAPN